LDFQKKVEELKKGGVIFVDEKSAYIEENVKIGKGTKISNSVIMQNTVIEENAQLDCVIVDKNATITQGVEIKGAKTLPVVVNKGKTV